MTKILDIDLYKNGFDVQHVDCVQGPIAAASGYFHKNNYFYYCFLHCLYNTKENIYLSGFSSYSNKILCNMGLKLERIDCAGYTGDETIKRISREVLNGTPVILIVRYNSLFYNNFYKNSTYRSNHGIIVNEFNEAKNLFGIKESTLLRDMTDMFENKDVYFSFHLTCDMLKNILEDSNNQFRAENHMFADSIYTLHQTDDIFFNTNKTLIAALPIFENWKNDLIDIINSFEGNKEFANNIVILRQRFCGSLKPIFHLLYDQCEQIKLDRVLVETVDKKVNDIRNKVLNALNKASVRCEEISVLRKAELCQLISEGDEILISLIKSLVKNQDKKTVMEFFVDIKGFYSNQAFEESMNVNSTADIMGQGTHYIKQNVMINEEWKKGEYCFYYSYTPGQYDNISCKGQEILIPNISANHISILACSVLGNYNENIEIEYSNGTKQNITADFSDFYKLPIFEEIIFWGGEAVQRKDGKILPHSFSAKLFAKKYTIESGEVVKLILPYRENVHIFALTLTNNEYT
jgi:hypothetical protein